MVKRALITGLSGQDGTYLAHLLLKKGYVVDGLVRRVSTSSDARLKALMGAHYAERVHIHEIDVTDSLALMRLLSVHAYDEVYHLAAQSHVGSSFSGPLYAAHVDGVATLQILEALTITGQKARFYQASTSELFGNSSREPQSESTPFAPRSPYACAKLYAYWITINYRDRGMFACNGILFNHESPLRGISFVTRAISYGVARVAHGLQDYITVGNLNAQRDWGYAPEYVEAMWRMMQVPEPDDFVIATGTTTSVRAFIEAAYAVQGVMILWVGTGVDETGIDAHTGQVRVRIDPQKYRPTEVDYLCGSAEKARRVLGWEPRVKVHELVDIMVRADNARVLSARQTGIEDLWNLPAAYMLQDTPDWLEARSYASWPARDMSI